jgi:hypothetical protein
MPLSLLRKTVKPHQERPVIRHPHQARHYHQVLKLPLLPLLLLVLLLLLKDLLRLPLLFLNLLLAVS